MDSLQFCFTTDPWHPLSPNHRRVSPQALPSPPPFPTHPYPPPRLLLKPSQAKTSRSWPDKDRCTYIYIYKKMWEHALMPPTLAICFIWIRSLLFLTVPWPLYTNRAGPGWPKYNVLFFKFLCCFPLLNFTEAKSQQIYTNIYIYIHTVFIGACAHAADLALPYMFYLNTSHVVRNGGITMCFGKVLVAE